MHARLNHGGVMLHATWHLLKNKWHSQRPPEPAITALPRLWNRQAGSEADEGGWESSPEITDLDQRLVCTAWLR